MYPGDHWSTQLAHGPTVQRILTMPPVLKPELGTPQTHYTNYGKAQLRGGGADAKASSSTSSKEEKISAGRPHNSKFLKGTGSDLLKSGATGSALGTRRQHNAGPSGCSSFDEPNTSQAHALRNEIRMQQRRQLMDDGTHNNDAKYGVLLPPNYNGGKIEGRPSMNEVS